MINGIYIASKTKHAERWRLLRANGVPIVSTWIDDAGEGETTDWNDLWERCIAEVKGARAVVLYVEPEETHKGTLIEVGVAIASGVPVFWVGPEIGSIRRYEYVSACASIEEAFAYALRGWAGRIAHHRAYNTTPPPSGGPR